jgi:hypothetical protein
VCAVFWLIVRLEIIRERGSDEAFGGGVEVFALWLLISASAHGVATATVARRYSVHVWPALGIADRRQRIRVGGARVELALFVLGRWRRLGIRIHNVSDCARWYGHSLFAFTSEFIFVLFLLFGATIIQTAALRYFVGILAIALVGLWRWLFGVLQLNFGALGLLAKLKRGTHRVVALIIRHEAHPAIPKHIEDFKTDVWIDTQEVLSLRFGLHRPDVSEQGAQKQQEH